MIYATIAVRTHGPYRESLNVPILPPNTVGIYDPVNLVVNSARFRLNDKLKSLYPHSGKILMETTAATQQAVNNGWRRFQYALADAGLRRFYDQAIILNVPPTTNLDQASECSLSWFGFFDGNNYNSVPALPRSLMVPLWMSERWSNTGFPFPDVNNPNMREQTDGLQSQIKWIYNGQWEWRNDAIYFPGAVRTVDFRIRFQAYLPDFVDVGTTRWWQQPVPIMRCDDPLSWWICSEFAAARAADGDASEQMLAVAAACKAEAMAATKLQANRDVNQREDVRREPYGGGSRGRGSGGYGY